MVIFMRAIKREMHGQGSDGVPQGRGKAGGEREQRTVVGCVCAMASHSLVGEGERGDC